MFYFELTLKEIAEFNGMTMEDLKQKSIVEVERLEKEMKKKKAFDEQTRNAEDEEYARIVRKYFTPFEYLKQWWTEEEIIYACSKNASVSDIVEKKETEAAKCYEANAEFIESRMGYVPQYDKHGRELAERKYTHVNVFRVTNPYQGLCHGKVFLDLLYMKFPELKEFNFNAYEFLNYEIDKYEIYPTAPGVCSIYTPFAALMNKDISAIEKRNRAYAKSYNYGEFTPEKAEERLKSPEVLHYFDVISNMKAAC